MTNINTLLDKYKYSDQVAVVTILTSLVVVVGVIGSAWWLMWKVGGNVASALAVNLTFV